MYATPLFLETRSITRQSPSSGPPEENLTLIIKKLAGLMALSLRIG